MGADEIKLYDSVSAKLSSKDEDKPKFFLGQKVKLLEDVKNDGTYPHLPVGALMMASGSVGYIKKMGEFLQVIRVYEVHFLGTSADMEVVGCREHELEAMDDEYIDEYEEDMKALKAHREKMSNIHLTNKEEK